MPLTLPISRPAGAALMALLAAFLWAGYYPLVLGVPHAAAPVALLAWPFIVGGMAYTITAVGTGHRASLTRLWLDPLAWGRVTLFVLMQAAILGSTYLAGPVDTSVLALIADVVLTPVFLAALYAEGTSRFRSGAFLLGISVCTGGSLLTIIAGRSVRPLSGLAIPLAAIVVVAVALYFLSMARASRREPTSAVVGQATLAAGLVVVLLSPLFPGGIAALRPPSLEALLALLGIGLTSFYLGPALYFRAIERAGLVLPAVLMAAIPVFTLLFAWLVLDLVPPALALSGIPLAVVGAFVALRGEHAPWTPEYHRPSDGSEA